mmetsp:Transcript_61770/g.139404  ORF Transcript_61770/g.139404 Transcript_61770/m.139404 type:complete len:225 (-) Transcript_61770:36-710(-)
MTSPAVRATISDPGRLHAAAGQAVPLVRRPRKLDRLQVGANAKPTAAVYESGPSVPASEPTTIRSTCRRSRLCGNLKAVDHGSLSGAADVSNQSREDALARSVTLVGEEEWAPVLLEALFRPSGEPSDTEDEETPRQVDLPRDTDTSSVDEESFFKTRQKVLLSLLPKPPAREKSKSKFLSDPSAVLKTAASRALETPHSPTVRAPVSEPPSPLHRRWHKSFSQ